MDSVNGYMLAMPNPVMNKPRILRVARRASQKIGKPISVSVRQASKRVRLDQRRVRRLPAMRPISMAAGKALNPKAASTRLNPATLKRKSVPQTAIDISAATTKKSTIQYYQNENGR